MCTIILLDSARNRNDSILKTKVKHKQLNEFTEKHRLGAVSKNHWRTKTCKMVLTSHLILMWIKAHRRFVCMELDHLNRLAKTPAPSPAMKQNPSLTSYPDFSGYRPSIVG